MNSKIGNISENWLLNGAKRLRKQLDEEEAEAKRLAMQQPSINADNPNPKPQSPLEDVVNEENVLVFSDNLLLKENIGLELYAHMMENYTMEEIITKLLKHLQEKLLLKEQLGLEHYAHMMENYTMEEVITKLLKHLQEKLLLKEQIGLEHYAHMMENYTMEEIITKLL